MEVTLKLYTNKRNDKVLYAEAGKEYVDFLGHLTVLPVGAVVGLVENASKSSSLGSLYGSFKTLDSNYFNFDRSKEFVLNAPSIESNPSLLDDSVYSVLNNLYICSHHYERCRKYVTLKHTPCPTCFNSTVCWALTPVGSKAFWEGGYVKSATSFMVMDDSAFEPFSTDTCIDLLSSFNLKAGTDLERKVVRCWEGGYGKSATSLMMMDDLAFKPFSTDTCIDMLSLLNLKAGTDLERKVVRCWEGPGLQVVEGFAAI